MKKRAFTLAELLIAMVILGVIAALTLPSLLQIRQQSAVGAVLAKIQATVEEATGRILVENPDEALDAGTFEDKLKNYLMMKKSDSSWKLKDGTTLAFSETHQPVPVNAGVGFRDMDVDLNGKGWPNKLGIDKYSFVLSSEGYVFPLGCAAKMASNNWKPDKDYDAKSCEMWNRCPGTVCNPPWALGIKKCACYCAHPGCSDDAYEVVESDCTCKHKCRGKSGYGYNYLLRRCTCNVSCNPATQVRVDTGSSCYCRAKTCQERGGQPCGGTCYIDDPDGYNKCKCEESGGVWSNGGCGTPAPPEDPCKNVSCNTCQKCSDGKCVADTSKNGQSVGKCKTCQNGTIVVDKTSDDCAEEKTCTGCNDCQKCNTKTGKCEADSSKNGNAVGDCKKCNNGSIVVDSDKEGKSLGNCQKCSNGAVVADKESDGCAEAKECVGGCNDCQKCNTKTGKCEADSTKDDTAVGTCQKCSGGKIVNDDKVLTGCKKCKDGKEVADKESKGCCPDPGTGGSCKEWDKQQCKYVPRKNGTPLEGCKKCSNGEVVADTSSPGCCPDPGTGGSCKEWDKQQCKYVPSKNGTPVGTCQKCSGGNAVIDMECDCEVTQGRIWENGRCVDPPKSDPCELYTGIDLERCRCTQDNGKKWIAYPSPGRCIEFGQVQIQER